MTPSSFNRINYIELLEYRYTKKYDTVLNAHLQAATTFIKISISLNTSMKALQILCWMQLQKKIQESELVAIIYDETHLQLHRRYKMRH